MKKTLLLLCIVTFGFAGISTAADYDPFQDNITYFYTLFGTDSSYACGVSYVPEYNPTVLYSPDSMRTDAPGFYTYFMNVQNRTETHGPCLWDGYSDLGYEFHHTAIDSFVVRPNSWTVAYGGDSLFIEKDMLTGDSYSYPNGGFTSNVTITLLSETNFDFLGTSDDAKEYSIEVDGQLSKIIVSQNFGIISSPMIHNLFRPSLSGTSYESMIIHGLREDSGATYGNLPSLDPIDYLSTIQPGYKRFWSVKQQTYDPYYGCFDFTSMYYDSIMTVTYDDDWFVYEYIEQDDIDSEIDSICLNSFRNHLQNAYSGNHIGNICEYDSIIYHNYGLTEMDTVADDNGDTLTLYSYMSITQQNYVMDLDSCTVDTTAALFPFQDKYTVYNNKFGLIEFGDTIYNQSSFSGSSVIYSLVGLMTETDTMGTSVGMGFFTPTNLNQYTGIYPNPVEVMFQVDIPFHHKPNPPYMIYDQTGRMVKVGYLDNLSMVMVPYLDQGLYYIHIDFGDEMVVEKFVKH